LRLKISNGLGQIGSQTVFAVLECFLRKEGDHIQVHISTTLWQEVQLCIRGVKLGCQYQRIGFPTISCRFNGIRGQYSARFVFQLNNHRFVEIGIPLQIHGEVVLLSVLDSDAVEAAVVHTDGSTCLVDGHLQVMGVVVVQG